jgi:hypothetical protein
MGINGSGDGQFQGHVGIARGSEGFAYVGNSSNSRIQFTLSCAIPINILKVFIDTHSRITK